ncbi:hypothetical protein R3P38DRAFT_3420868 [Favolaschia claudopus]|uniref:Uncharacterized protein n=1 Tax=Favolaschia claudopus TaxID=2862362 RepID=A0AAW0D4X4_9AGAR
MLLHSQTPISLSSGFVNASSISSSAVSFSSASPSNFLTTSARPSASASESDPTATIIGVSSDISTSNGTAVAIAASVGASIAASLVVLGGVFFCIRTRSSSFSSNPFKPKPCSTFTQLPNETGNESAALAWRLTSLETETTALRERVARLEARGRRSREGAVVYTNEKDDGMGMGAGRGKDCPPTRRGGGGMRRTVEMMRPFTVIISIDDAVPHLRPPVAFIFARRRCDFDTSTLAYQCSSSPSPRALHFCLLTPSSLVDFFTTTVSDAHSPSSVTFSLGLRAMERARSTSMPVHHPFTPSLSTMPFPRTSPSPAPSPAAAAAIDASTASHRRRHRHRCAANYRDPELLDSCSFPPLSLSPSALSLPPMTIKIASSVDRCGFFSSLSYWGPLAVVSAAQLSATGELKPPTAAEHGREWSIDAYGRIEGESFSVPRSVASSSLITLLGYRRQKRYDISNPAKTASIKNFEPSRPP